MKRKTEGRHMPKTTADQLTIRTLVENWALWRDARLWDRFRTVWHKEGRMMATWTQGTVEEFIKMSDEGWERGMKFLHFLGGSSVDVKGKRAIAQTKMTISQRAPIEGVVCDVVCTGRFYDFLEKRKGRWGIVLRRLAYENNRTYSTYSSYVEKAAPEIAANTVICLIHQANYLLDQQLRQLEEAFLNEGGFTERLYHERKKRQ